MGASVEYCDIHDCHYEVDSAGGLNQCGYCYENNNQTKLNNMIGSTIIKLQRKDLFHGPALFVANEK